jgi:four helix bundle protein
VASSFKLIVQGKAVQCGNLVPANTWFVGILISMGHFKNLKAWEHARALAVISKPLIDRLPTNERSGLADQWRRAASSVVLNIAEGASRRGAKEFRKHLDIARASLDEIEAIIDLAVGLDYLRREEVSKVTAVRDECARTVFGLIRKLGIPINS